MVPCAGEKITVEGVKYVLSSHYQGTVYDPYGAYGDKSMRGAYRSIGINRNDFLSVIQMRPDLEKDAQAVEWVAFASNAFNVLVPFYADVLTTPEYLSNTTGEVSTDNFYWGSRMIAAMADASYKKSISTLSATRRRLCREDMRLSDVTMRCLHRRGMSISAWS